MAIVVRQSSSSESSKRWKWSIWLEGQAGDLDDVESVVYELHPTFRDPIRTVTDRPSGFRLIGSAWGEFLVHITLNYSSGETGRREHWLRLGTGAPTKGDLIPTQFKGVSPTVFVAASLADADLAGEMKKALRDQGVKVVSQDDLSAGAEWQSQLHSMMESADLGIAVVSENASPWVESEVAEMRNQHTPVIPLMRGDIAVMPGTMRDLKAIRVEQGSDPLQVADQILQIMPALINQD